MLGITFTMNDAEEGSIRKLIFRLVQVPRNDAAWEEFFRRFSTPIFRIIGVAFHKYHGRYSQGEVCDFAQDLYKRLLDNNGRALLQFRGATEREFLGYLTQICCNLLRDSYPKKGGSGVISLDATLIDEDLGADRYCPVTDPDQERAVQRRELRDFIVKRLHKICHGEEAQRNTLIFMLRHYDERPSQEVAQLLGILPSSVDTIYHRIKKHIEADLTEALARQKNKFDKLL